MQGYLNISNYITVALVDGTVLQDHKWNLEWNLSRFLNDAYYADRDVT